MTTEATDETAMTEAEAAELLGVARETLARMRRARTGPKHFRVGARGVRYVRKDVLEHRAAMVAGQEPG